MTRLGARPLIDFIEIRLGTGAGCACHLCTRQVAEEFRSVDDILADVQRVIDEWPAGTPGPNMAFVGPEPYHHPRLPTLVQRAVAAGVQRLSLNTDAAALAMPDNAAGSVDAGIRHIEVPLLGGSADTHDALSGVPGSYDASVAGMQALVAAAGARGVPALVCGRIRVCSHNVRELPAIVVAFARAGANSVTIELDGSVPRTVARPWVGAAVDTGIVSNVWVALEGADTAEYQVAELHGHNAMRALSLSDEGAA